MSFVRKAVGDIPLGAPPFRPSLGSVKPGRSQFADDHFRSFSLGGEPFDRITLQPESASRLLQRPKRRATRRFATESVSARIPRHRNGPVLWKCPETARLAENPPG